MNVYKEILREEWDKVSPKVKRSHLSGKTLHAHCRLDIIGSTNPLGRLISRMVSFPPPMNAANVALHIRSSPDGEIWERAFTMITLRSVQSRSSEGFLIDRFGMIAFSFRLEVLNGGIVHNHVRTNLRLGLLSLPLPRFLAPRVISHEEPDPIEDASRISVSVHYPIIGHLLTYSGIVRPVESMA